MTVPKSLSYPECFWAMGRLVDTLETRGWPGNIAGTLNFGGCWGVKRVYVL